MENTIKERIVSEIERNETMAKDKSAKGLSKSFLQGRIDGLNISLIIINSSQDKNE